MRKCWQVCHSNGDDILIGGKKTLKYSEKLKAEIFGKLQKRGKKSENCKKAENRGSAEHSHAYL